MVESVALFHYMFVIHDIYDSEGAYRANFDQSYIDSIEYILKLYKDRWISVSEFMILGEYSVDLLNMYKGGDDFFDNFN